MAQADITFAIGGTVTRKGDPLPDATVTVQDAVLTATTDADGRYTLAPLPPGTHTLVVTHQKRRREKQIVLAPAMTEPADYDVALK